MKGGENMRLFIALPVSADARRALGKTQDALRQKGVKGRLSPPENLHVTLCFLGNVKDPAPAIAAMKSVPVPKTALRFDRLTLFGDVAVALLKQDTALSDYVRRLRVSLDDAGVGYDRQAFRPHVTLCRKTALPYPSFRLSAAAKPLAGMSLSVFETRLMASDLTGPTPKYTVLFRKRPARKK